jgi:hypothetical protein
MVKTVARSRSLIPAFFVVLVAAAVGFIVYYSVPAIDSAFSGGCASGWAGFGCVIMASLASLVLAPVVAGVLAFVALRALKVGSSGWVAGFGTLISASMISGTYKNLAQGFNGALIWDGITLVCFVFTYILLLVLKSRKGWAVLILGIIVVLLYIFAGRIASGINTQSFNSQQAAVIQGAEFTVYLPQSLPAGWRYGGGSLANPLDEFNPGSEPASESYSIEYDGAVSPDSITPQFYFEFSKVTGLYQPPANCGPEEPGVGGQVSVPCQKIGSTAQGEIVYFATTKSPTTELAYAQIGQTLVVMRTSYNASFSTGDILTMFKSLKAESGSELEALNNSVKN